MKLYHGGANPVPTPLPESPVRNRPLDFGSGFYATTSLEQAQRWIRLRREQDAKFGNGVVSRYVINEAEIESSDLKVLRVSKDNLDPWFDFVMANRHTKAFTHDYDLVIGPVANDKVFVTLTLFEQGIIDKFMAIQQLKTFVLRDQYLFHTAKALKYLRFDGTEE